jgi:hypothetical protein
MAEILLRIVDSVTDDPKMAERASKRGDVISVQRDGWPWGREELKSEFWRVVKMPGVDPRDLADLMEPEVLAGKDGTLTIVRKRAKQLNVDKLESVLVTKLDDSTKTGAEKAVVALDAIEVTAVLAVRETKPVIEVVKVG